MRSQRDGGLSAITQVKVFSPVIFIIAPGQGIHYLEASTGACVNGEHVVDVPGSKAMVGNRTVHTGTWESRAGGIDGVSWKAYGVHLDENLKDLVARMKAKRYKPLPARWATRKYKKLKRHRRRATHWLRRAASRQPFLFAHWQLGVRPAAGQ